MVKYVVLDIEPIRGYQNQGKWISAEVQVARESDFGRNDKVFFAKTHLGHLLNPGRLVVGR
jgi:nonsense-mediated mRNA decay protein 3